MAICPLCSQSSAIIGEECQACHNAYTVQNNHGKDPLNLLGRLIANKFIPTSVISETSVTVVYEAFQPAVDRTVCFVLVRPEVYANEVNQNRIQTIIDKCSGIKQQNTLNILEVLTIAELRTIAITYEALKGEQFGEFLKHHAPDPVAYMHIIHQLLQAMSAYHMKGVCFPHISPRSMRIFRSGSDNFFVKIAGVIDSHLLYIQEANSAQDDVYYIGQIALSLITGKSIPISTVELTPDRAFLMPIAQLFMRTLAPKDQRFESCIELLQAFEIAFALNAHEPEPPAPISQKASTAKKNTPKHTPIPFEQIIWMHRPPEAI